MLINTLLFLLCFWPNPAGGLDLDEQVRAVRFGPKGDTIVLSVEQLRRGKRLFNAACAFCHVAGLTKPNPNLGLDLVTLSCAMPPSDNIIDLVKFLKRPRTYDNRKSISDLHPSIKSADIFQKTRSLSKKDLFAISGHILYQNKVLNERWGGGKCTISGLCSYLIITV